MAKYRYETSKGTYEIESNRQLTPEELTNVIGGGKDFIAKTPPKSELVKAKAKRLGALATKEVVGKIPFVGKKLPKSIMEIEPYGQLEKAVQPVSAMARDMLLLRGVGKLNTLRTALRGAGIGIATAGTEDPEEILKDAAIGALTLPIIKKGTESVSSFIGKAAHKGLKATRQAWQDLIRAGFMVEKSTVQRIQEKGMKKLFDKKLGFRDDDAVLKLGEKVFNSAQKIRRSAGDVVGRWRNQLFKNTKIKVSVDKPRATFKAEINKPGVGLQQDLSNPSPTQVRLKEIDDMLNWGNDLPPDKVYRIVDRLDDLITDSKKGVLSIGKNAGRIVANLRRDLKAQIFKAAPRSTSKGLKAAEDKFSVIADATDDIFNKLPLRKEGVALSERVGATERNLMRGLRHNTPVEERQIYDTLDKLLPKEEKFMELYKDIFAAQDLQGEGIGWLFRRLILSPRMAAAGMKATQPIMKGGGHLLRATGSVLKEVTPAVGIRKALNSMKGENPFNIKKKTKEE